MTKLKKSRLILKEHNHNFLHKVNIAPTFFILIRCKNCNMEALYNYPNAGDYFYTLRDDILSCEENIIKNIIE